MTSPTLTWAILMSATIGSFATAEYLPQRHVAVAAILLIAAFKVRTILRNFMELRDAPKPWKITFDAWTFFCAVMITSLCWYTMP
jgi:predicted alpha/beta hydrolase family esterase